MVTMISDPTNHRRFTPNRTGEAAPLGQLERLVMQVLWRETTEPLSVTDVHAALEVTQGASVVAYTTVKTTLERLAEKGILIQIKAGKAYHYQAAQTESELERRIVTATLDKLVREFPHAVASFFIRPDPNMTQERLELLREAIQQRREGENLDPLSGKGDV